MFAHKGNKEFCFARVSTRNKDDRFQQFFDEINILRGEIGQNAKGDHSIFAQLSTPSSPSPKGFLGPYVVETQQTSFILDRLFYDIH